MDSRNTIARLSRPRSTIAPPPSAAPVEAPRKSARERGYTTRWDKLSKAYLRAHPLCLGCQAAGITRPSQLTDHIIPHRGDKGLFWDAANRQPSCRWHHDVVKETLEHRFEAGLVMAEDLRLDSPIALALSDELRGR